MINVSVGDIFYEPGSSALYRVTRVQQSKNFPDDPYFEVDVFVAERGWDDAGDIGFLLSEAKYKSFTFFKQTEL